MVAELSYSSNQQSSSNNVVNGGASNINIELATWSSNTTSSFNGRVLSFEGSLGFDGLPLFHDSHVALERGSIYGLVAPNGSGKTSLVRALPTLPDFPLSSQFRMEYLCADFDIPSSADAGQDDDDSSMTARRYCLARLEARVRELEVEIDQLETLLETSCNDCSLEDISNQLSEFYEVKGELELEAAASVDQMFTALNFGDYADMQFSQLSSGWRYKCQLISTLVTRPDCLVVDEPSFLDTTATAWFVSEIQHLTRSNNAMVVLISHKEALMEEVCDRILYLNPASKNLTVYNCTFREFQAAHADRVAHAKKIKEQADGGHKDAKESLGTLRKQLQKREQNCQTQRLAMFTDKRWIKGKNKEAKQKADHSAAAKVKRMQKIVAETSAQEEKLRETRIVPLELDGADTSGNGQPLFELCDVSFRYEGSRDILLEYVDVQITGKDKVLVQGANGQGKTTLAKLILGQMDPSSGEVRRHASVVAHFHQDALLNLIYRHGHATAVDFLLTKDVKISLTEARTYLGRFGLKGTLCVRPICSLSAGQRVRLWLAREFWGDHKPSLLILDEVTENLDKETADSLLASLENFSAAIMAISHDDYFCEQFPATQLWAVGRGRVRVKFQHKNND